MEKKKEREGRAKGKKEEGKDMGKGIIEEEKEETWKNEKWKEGGKEKR